MFSLNFRTKRKRISMEFMSEDFFDNFWSDAKLKMKEIHKYLMEGFLGYEVEQFLGAQSYQLLRHVWAIGTDTTTENPSDV